MGLAETSGILWRERELLELLVYKLEQERLVLAAGLSRWLGHATREVEVVLERVRETELLRSVEVDAAAAELGIDAGPSLAELAGAAPEPWGDLLREHRRALLGLAAEIRSITEANRDLIGAGQRAVRDAMHLIGGSGGVYGRDGTTAPISTAARLVDEAV
jgi:hypothetical protein